MVLSQEVMKRIKRGTGGGDGSTEQEVTGEPRAGGGASPGYRLRRCDEEHGRYPVQSQSANRFWAEQKAVNGTFVPNV